MAVELIRPPSRLAAWWDSDLCWSFRHTPSAVISAALLILIIASAVLAPAITPQNPFDLTQLFLDKAELPPVWAADGEMPYLLGTDPQGRDIFSAILYGSRISLVIGAASVLLAAGTRDRGRPAGRLLWRLSRQPADADRRYRPVAADAADRHPVQRDLQGAAAGRPARVSWHPGILVLSIAAVSWVQYARVVRSSTMVEAGKEYVQAARIIRVRPHSHHAGPHPAQRA